jgi:hypothetical protein
VKFAIYIFQTITQVLQERVEEEHRGVLNGVQVGFLCRKRSVITLEQFAIYWVMDYNLEIGMGNQVEVMYQDKMRRCEN